MASGDSNPGSVDAASFRDASVSDESAIHGRKRPSLVIVLVLVAAGTVILAALARFSQTLRPPLPVSSMLVRVPVSIDTVPQGASITVDDHDAGTTPLTSSLPVGVHTVEFTRDGFAHLRRRIELAPGSPLDVRLPLSPLPGSLRVLTDAEEATVAVDGHPLDESDHQFVADDLAPGTHQLTISGKQARASINFEIKPGAAPVLSGPAETHDFTVAAISRFGDDCTVISSADAKIGLTHGPMVDAGPEAKPLPISDDESAELSGTGLARRTVPLSRATVPSLSILAAIEGGSLVVITGVDDAVVSINGTVSRRQPQNGRLYFSGLTPGDYEVRVSRPGGVEKSMKVTVAKDQQTQVPLPLQGATTSASKTVVAAPIVRPAPAPALTRTLPPPRADTGAQGLARFVVKTPGARVTIRRADVPDPLTRLIITDSLRLPVGRWLLTATAPGFKTYTTYFLVNDAGPADVFVKLERDKGKAKNDRE